MEIELAAKPPEATWPEGVTVRTFERGRDEQACHALQNLAWAEYETYKPMTFERWTDLTREPDFDPEIWFLAEENGELVGMCLCREYEDQAWVPWLAVHAKRRGRGLGEALLRHAFARLRARRNVRVGLSVSSRTTHSARRLHERLSMHDAGGWNAYEKVLRATEAT
jgi:ribosomal protein S18 acetylase RimI-like enzyme